MYIMWSFVQGNDPYPVIFQSADYFIDASFHGILGPASPSVTEMIVPLVAKCCEVPLVSCIFWWMDFIASVTIEKWPCDAIGKQHGDVPSSCHSDRCYAVHLWCISVLGYVWVCIRILPTLVRGGWSDHLSALLTTCHSAVCLWAQAVPSTI